MRAVGGEWLEVVGPCGKAAAGDVGLGNVIDNETQAGKRRHRLQCGGKLARPDQKIVGKTAPLDLGQTANDIVAQQPFGIRLVMHLMPDADQPTAVRRCKQSIEPVADIGCR